MKKTVLYILVGFFFLAGCYKDKGNYTYTELVDFYVDTTNIQRSFIVPQYSILELPSNLVYDGDKSKLKFSWSIYLPAQGIISNAADTISVSENLSVPISVFPENYVLEFSATDTETGRRTTRLYDLTVESIGAGFMVLYEKDGKVDFDLVKTKLFEGLLDEDIVVRNLYTLANPDRPLTGAAVGIGMIRMATQQQISLYSENDGVAISPADFSISKKFNQFFLSPPLAKKPEAYFAPTGITNPDYEASSGFELLINDGKCYANIFLLSGGGESFYSLFLKASGDYTAAPFPIWGAGRIVVYDQQAMQILSAGIGTTTLSPLVNSGSAFNFTNIGKKLIYLSYGFGGPYVNYGIFKNPVDDGKRYLYVMDFLFNSAQFTWDISGLENIQNAEHFAFGTRGPLVYYTAGNKIYQIVVDYNGQSVNGGVTAFSGIPADEEITYMDLSRVPGRNVSENAREKYLFVATYNNSTNTGKLYVLEANITSGVLKQTPVAVFEGFGKIKDIAFKF